MKKVLVFLLACFACTAMFAQGIWAVDESGCLGTNCTIYGRLFINGNYAGGTTQDPENETLYIGVFDQDGICRGVGNPRWLNSQSYYYYAITCRGYNGCTYTNFKVWDMEANAERTDLTFESTWPTVDGLPEYPNGFPYVGDKIGSIKKTYALNFLQTATGIDKEIIGYEDEGVDDKWYFLSSPIGAIEDASTVTNLLEGEYDFYKFDQTGADDGMEWKNYEANAFGFELGKGYLYAKQEGCTITFNGTAYGLTENGTFELDYIEECEDPNMKGWNLMGNPYNTEAAVDKTEFLVMVDAALVPNTGNTIGRMEGIMVKATEPGQSVTFTPNEIGDKKALFALNVTSGSKLVDRAVVRFGQGGQLPKFQLKESTKVYIPMDGEEYSVVRSEGMGELPVNFKATKNGSYTMCINSENVSFGYLHLIDNLTGADQDLLANPSYTFEARTTDYTSRFKLVFATGNTEDDFAFFSNGSLVINNEGNATLQVVDVTGRIIKCENINGCASVNIDAASGVYMIRLVNGDNVKVQKVVK